MLNKAHPDYVQFPDPNLADDHGFLIHGGNLQPNTLLSAYQQGIFPWFNEGEPILWWSPNPRMILPTGKMHVSRSLQKTIRSKRYRITCNQAFSKVIACCGQPRPMTNQAMESGTWITATMQEAYQALFSSGYAVSIEAWHDDKLVGGLYGVSIAGMFFGESMFSKKPDSSKVALYHLCQFLNDMNVQWIDCQVESPHLMSLGARKIARQDFLDKIASQLQSPIFIDWSQFGRI